MNNGQEQSDEYLGKPNNGSIAITQTMIKSLGMNEIQVFKKELEMCLKDYGINDSCAGWYARKLENGIWYFLWACSRYRITKTAYSQLKKHGWQMAHPEGSFSHSLYKD